LSKDCCPSHWSNNLETDVKSELKSMEKYIAYASCIGNPAGSE
jgi:hypothetical protein